MINYDGRCLEVYKTDKKITKEPVKMIYSMKIRMLRWPGKTGDAPFFNISTNLLKNA
jgi:hypothetical protein